MSVIDCYIFGLSLMDCFVFVSWDWLTVLFLAKHDWLMFFLQAELDELRGEKFSLEERLKLMETEQAHRLVFTISMWKVSVVNLDPDPFRTVPFCWNLIRSQAQFFYENVKIYSWENNLLNPNAPHMYRLRPPWRMSMAADSVADPDPGSGAFLIPGSGIRDGLKIKILIRDPDPDHISESLETYFGSKSLMRIWIRYPEFFNPGSGSNTGCRDACSPLEKTTCSS